MTIERHVSFFRNGRNQAIRIPREFELPGTEGIIRKDGARLIIEARPTPRTLADLLGSWAPLPEPFPDIADPLPEPVEL